MKRYVGLLAIGTAGLLAAVGTANLVIDPYRIWHRVPVAGAGAPAETAGRYDPKAQFVQATARKPQVLLVGASRTHIGLDPNHPAIGASRGFNFGMPAQSPAETREVLERVADVDRRVAAIWGLDYAVFACSFSAAARRLPGSATTHGVELLFELDSAVASLRALAAMFWGPATTAALALSNGRMIFPEARLANIGGHRALSHDLESRFVGHVTRAAYCSPASLEDALGVYRSALARFHRSGNHMTLHISAAHGRLLQTIHSAGHWPRFETWKRALVRINAEEAARANAKPFPLWDFSGFTGLTTEPFPPLGDKETKMKWYWESSHYKKELGDLVLDRIFDYRHPEREVPRDFGVLLTPENIEAHLAWIREGRERWAKQFPEDVREIAELARKAGMQQAAR